MGCEVLQPTLHDVFFQPSYMGKSLVWLYPPPNLVMIAGMGCARPSGLNRVIGFKNRGVEI